MRIRNESKGEGMNDKDNFEGGKFTKGLSFIILLVVFVFNLGISILGANAIPDTSIRFLALVIVDLFIANLIYKELRWW